MVGRTLRFENEDLAISMGIRWYANELENVAMGKFIAYGRDDTTMEKMDDILTKALSSLEELKPSEPFQLDYAKSGEKTVGKWRKCLDCSVRPSCRDIYAMIDEMVKSKKAAQYMFEALKREYGGELSESV